MKKRLMALLLVLTMVVSMLPVSVFAAEEEQKLNYVSLGDSMSNGYCFTGYDQGNITAHQFLTGEKVYGDSAYPNLFAAWLAAETGKPVNHRKLAVSAMRAEDLNYLLGGREMPTDGWFSQVEHYSGTDGDALKGIYQEAVSDANVITMSIGNASFGAYMVQYFTRMLGVMGGSLPEEEKVNLEKALEVLEPEQKAVIMEAYNQMMVLAEGYLPEELGPIADIQGLIDMMAYIGVGFLLNYEGVLDQIVELNPDVEVVLVGLMNTTYGMNVTGEFGSFPIGDVVDIMFDALNAYIAGLPAAKQAAGEWENAKFYYTDMPNPEFIVQVFDDLYEQDWPADLEGLSGTTVRNRTIKAYNEALRPMIGAAMGFNLPAITLSDVDSYVFDTDDEHGNGYGYSYQVMNQFMAELPVFHTRLADRGGNHLEVDYTNIPLVERYIDAKGLDFANVEANCAEVFAADVEKEISIAIYCALEESLAESVDSMDITMEGLEYMAGDIMAALGEMPAALNPANNPGPYVIKTALVEWFTGSDTALAMCKIFAMFKVGDGMSVHPTPKAHERIAASVVNAYSTEYTVQDETMKNTLEALEIAKDLVLEYYDEAYAYGYAYAADNGYIAMAQKGIADSIVAIKAIDLDATDMTEEFKAQLQVELDALVVTLEKLNAALAAGQFATVDSLVTTFMALESDLYAHLENIKNLSLQAGSDVYEQVVLPAIDYIYTVTIPQAKQAVQAVLDQAWQYIVTKIYEAYGIVIDINTSVQDMIDMVQTCIAKKIAEAMGIIVDINATVQDIINAIREHIEHITAGEIVLTEDFFYLAIEDSDFYAELVAEALKLSEDQYMEVTLDEVTPELLARADFITIGYNNMNSLYFGVYQIMGVANVYLQDAYEFIYTVDAKFDAAYPGMENSGIDLYTKAMDALYEQGGIYLWLVEGMELAELNWEALVGAESLPYIEEARAQMQAAFVEAGVPATYPVSFDVVAEVIKMTKDYAPLDENALRNALGEHAVFSLDIPVADLAVFAVESVLYDYIAYNQNYSNTMMTINAINPDATVAALGNYSRLDLDYEFVIDEMSFVPAEVLAQFGFEGFVLPDEAKEALAAVAAMGIYEFDIPTTDAMEALLAQYNELAQYAVSFELPASEEAALLIADLVETANACVAYAAEQVEDVYTVTIPVTDLMNLAVEHGQQLDVLINASLNTEVVIASQTIQVNDILALLANLSSLHPFSYASAFGNVFYVDITGAQMGGMEYIADRILSALTITCAHTDHDNDHFCDLWCGIELSKCADNDADHFCDICGAELSKCADNDADHFCDVCDIRLSPCFDAQNDGNHACDYCGMANVTAHRYSAATCAAPGRCFECGVTSGSVLAHTEEIIPAVEATCTATGLTEGKKCSVCGKILVAQETVEKLAHTEEIIPAVEATCTATGLTEGKKCSVCGEILVAQETVEKLAHTEEVISAVDATCTATGLTEGKKCSVCGEILVAQETVEKLAHTEVSIPAVEATCTAAGKTEGKKCSVCGEILVAQEAVAKLAHTEAVIPAVEATCTAAGKTEGKKCSVCGEILVAQGTIAAKGHTEETIPATEATCTTAGKTEGKKCSVCGEILVAQETVAAKGHSFGEWSVSKEATRKEAGEETRSCACGETETREIPALGGANVGVIVGASVGGVGILAVAVFFLLKKKMLF